jgi:hypothetical protein
VFLGVCCLFQIGAGLSSVNMPPWVIACSSKRGAPTVFKCGLARFGRHFGSARHGNADPAPARGTSVHGVDWSEAVCVRVRRARAVQSIVAGHAFYHTSSMHQEGTTVEKIGQKYFSWAHHHHQNY